MFPSASIGIGIVWKGNGLTVDDAFQIIAVAQYWYTRLYNKKLYIASFEQFLYDALTKKVVGSIAIQWIDSADIFLYSGAPCIMILNGVWYSFPISGNITPICVSMSWLLDTVEVPIANQLRKLGPIGCRDHHTECVLQLAGVPCYFSGCICSIIEQGYYKYLSLFKSTTTELCDNSTLFTELFQPISLAYEQLYLMAQNPTPFRTSNLNVFIAARSFGMPVTFIGIKESRNLLLLDKVIYEPHLIRKSILAMLDDATLTSPTT
jgi:hypothetical protein